MSEEGSTVPTTTSQRSIEDEVEMKRKRAERFGTAPPELTEEEKKAIRASRFGVNTPTSISAKLDAPLSAEKKSERKPAAAKPTKAPVSSRRDTNPSRSTNDGNRRRNDRAPASRQNANQRDNSRSAPRNDNAKPRGGQSNARSNAGGRTQQPKPVKAVDIAILDPAEAERRVARAARFNQ